MRYSNNNIERVEFFMKKLVLVLVSLMLILSIGSAMANIYGGVQERIDLTNANKGAHQATGDQGGEFTKKLNMTQEIYYTYDWDMNWYSLAQDGPANITWSYASSAT